MIDALTSGLLAGYGIAVPVGAIGVLIVTLAARVSLRHGAAAGLGVATADGLYALAAVVGGVTVARLVSPAIAVLQAAAAVVLAAIAVRGIVVAVRASRAPADATRSTPARSLIRTYATFVGLTLLNPMTIVYFAALVVGHQGGAADSTSSLLLVGAVFVAAAFVASASWQVLLASGGALLGRTLASPRGRLVTALVGNGIIGLLAIRLAWQAVS
ncbi:LysE family transporter [Solwaraspora sp. WMMD792]|uniref:LysE family transporter n=1 Tax=Solwaraspora sp. WMMD792 TaxID=3016099 RepID=UPI002415BB05|nr:LysE family transporter [Solwaraspora sp. WMMD792]MDG4775139.1 LysE family transporter [Solwaraspora sp. WMMD792]